MRGNNKAKARVKNGLSINRWLHVQHMNEQNTVLAGTTDPNIRWLWSRIN